MKTQRPSRIDFTQIAFGVVEQATAGFTSEKPLPPTVVRNVAAMTPERFEALLNGGSPTLDDFEGFVSVIEKLPAELLWKLSKQGGSLHWMLKKPLLTTLQSKVTRQCIDEHTFDVIVEHLVVSKP